MLILNKIFSLLINSLKLLTLGAFSRTYQLRDIEHIDQRVLSPKHVIKISLIKKKVRRYKILKKYSIF